MLEPHQIERALVITAHPDDVDFGAAGTVANLTDAGVEVTYCLVTDGEAGGFDQTIERTRMAAIRREEQTKAAAEVGVTDLCFLGYSDGAVEFNLDLRHGMSRVIRRCRPQVVITQSPHINVASVYGSHADHVATGQGVWAAVYPDARNPFAFPELLTSGFEPWSVDEIWIMNHHDARMRSTSRVRSNARSGRCDAMSASTATLMRWRSGSASGSVRTPPKPVCPRARPPNGSTSSTPADLVSSGFRRHAARHVASVRMVQGGLNRRDSSDGARRFTEASTVPT